MNILLLVLVAIGFFVTLVIVANELANFQTYGRFLSGTGAFWAVKEFLKHPFLYKNPLILIAMFSEGEISISHISTVGWAIFSRYYVRFYDGTTFIIPRFSELDRNIEAAYKNPTVDAMNFDTAYQLKFNK